MKKCVIILCLLFMCVGCCDVNENINEPTKLPRHVTKFYDAEYDVTCYIFSVSIGGVNYGGIDCVSNSIRVKGL